MSCRQADPPDNKHRYHSSHAGPKRRRTAVPAASSLRRRPCKQEDFQIGGLVQFSPDELSLCFLGLQSHSHLTQTVVMSIAFVDLQSVLARSISQFPNLFALEPLSRTARTSLGQRTGLQLWNDNHTNIITAKRTASCRILLLLLLC